MKARRRDDHLRLPRFSFIAPPQQAQSAESFEDKAL